MLPLILLALLAWCISYEEIILQSFCDWLRSLRCGSIVSRASCNILFFMTIVFIMHTVVLSINSRRGWFVWIVVLNVKQKEKEFSLLDKIWITIMGNVRQNMLLTDLARGYLIIVVGWLCIRYIWGIPQPFSLGTLFKVRLHSFEYELDVHLMIKTRPWKFSNWFD